MDLKYHLPIENKASNSMRTAVRALHLFQRVRVHSIPCHMVLISFFSFLRKRTPNKLEERYEIENNE